MNITIPESIETQVIEALAILDKHLGESIQAIYLFGSAVDGGLKPLSDIDLMVTVKSSLEELPRRALIQELLKISAFPGSDATRRALEVTVLARDEVVPWRHPAIRQIQFGEWLRDDISDGKFEQPMLDHDLAIMVTKVRQHSLPLRGPAAVDYFDEVPFEDVRRSLLETLALWNCEADWEGDERNIILALVRIWYTATTRDIASKEAAANWALERLPAEHQYIARAARDAYLGCEDVDLAEFPQERTELLDFIRSSVNALLVSP